jgi:hypothetical protein
VPQLPLSSVPKPLIPFFRAGGMSHLWNIAEQYGTGLPFFNAIAKLYPRDKSVPIDFYRDLTSWLSRFAKESLAGGSIINELKSNDLIDPNVLPKNFYLKRPDYQMCNHYFNVTYEVENSWLPGGPQRRAFHFESELTTKGALYESIAESLQRTMDLASIAKNRDLQYQLKVGSIQVEAGVRLC